MRTLGMMATSQRAARPGESFASLLGTLPLAALILDRDGVIKEANDFAVAALLRPRTKLRRTDFATLVKNDRAGWLRMLKATLRLKKPRNWDGVRISRGDGSKFIAEILISPASGVPCGSILLILLEVAREKRAIQNILNEHERLKFHVENSPLAVIEYDHEFKIRRWSPQAEKLFGWPSLEVIGKHNLELHLVHSHDRAKVSYAINRLIDRTEPRNVLRNRNYRKDGSILLCEWYNSALMDEQGKVTSILSLAQDISRHEQGFMERAIATVSERERQRIGHELHDTLAQQLAGLAFLSKTFQVKLKAQLPELAGDAAQLAGLASEAAVQVRNLSSGLYPAELERRGLVAALNELVVGQSQIYDIPCALETSGRSPALDSTIALNLYRIAQEAVTNALKHGRASRVRVRFRSTARAIVLTITDDGRGFKGKTAPSSGMGIRIMNYRAESIGATLEMGPARPRGTLISCTLPLKAEYTQ